MMPGHNTAVAFRNGIENIEAIDDQIAELKESIKGLKGQRKHELDVIRTETGFIPKVTDQMIRERRMDVSERAAFAMQLQLARGTLGLLDGTPLGEAARRAYDPKPQAPSESRTEDDRQDALPEVPDLPQPDAPADEDDKAAAWQAGVDAARAGKKLSDNPYPADRPALRAAYDEGWCHENGSDGMDIPDALKPKKKDSDDKGGK